MPIRLTLLPLLLLELGGRSPLDLFVFVVGLVNILLFSSVFEKSLDPGVGLLMPTLDVACGDAGRAVPIVGMWLALWFGILDLLLAEAVEEEDNVF